MKPKKRLRALLDTKEREMATKKKATKRKTTTTKRKVASKPKVKKASSKSATRKNSAFMKALSLSKDLEAVVGKGPLPRTEVVKKLWVYIKKHKLQDPKNLRNIKPDSKLAQVLGSKTISMFQMTKAVSKHLT